MSAAYVGAPENVQLYEWFFIDVYESCSIGFNYFRVLSTVSALEVRRGFLHASV